MVSLWRCAGMRKVSKNGSPAKPGGFSTSSAIARVSISARPIVSTSVGDIPAWLADGAGVVVPPGDSWALGEAIQRVLEQPDQARRMGVRARERFAAYAFLDRDKGETFIVLEIEHITRRSHIG